MLFSSRGCSQDLFLGILSTHVFDDSEVTTWGGCGVLGGCQASGAHCRKLDGNTKKLKNYYIRFVQTPLLCALDGGFLVVKLLHCACNLFVLTLLFGCNSCSFFSSSVFKSLSTQG